MDTQRLKFLHEILYDSSWFNRKEPFHNIEKL